MTFARGCLLPGLLLVLALTACDALVSPQQHIDKARAALEAGKSGLAAIELQKAVRSDPENPAARLLLARLSLGLGDGADAQQNLARAIKAGAKGPDVEALQVEIWLATNQPQALIDALTRNELSLAEPDRSIALARAYNGLGQPDLAIKALEPALAARAPATATRLAHAQALVMRGESDQALQEVDAVIAADRRSLDAALLKGLILMHRGQFAAAEDALLLARNRSSEATPIRERAFVLAAITEAQLAQGKINPASESEAVLLKVAPEAAVTQLLGARIKLARGDYLNGIADLGRLVVRAPDFIPARMALGAAQLLQGNLLQAQAQLAEVVARAPDNLEARKLLARVRLQLDQPDAALHVLTPALDDDAADPQLYVLLGAARSSAGDTDAALGALEKGVRANPADATLKLELAQADLAVGRDKDALALLEPIDVTKADYRRDTLFVTAVGAVRGPRAARDALDKLLHAHSDIITLNVAASYFITQWEFERARALLGQALALDARNVMSLVNQARLQLATDDAAGAQTTLQAALKADEHNTAVRIALSDLMVRRGELADAQHLLESAPADSSNLDLQFAMGQLYLAHGDLPRANAAFDRALALQPERADLINRAGVALLQGQQYEAALARFRKATERAPGSAVYWLNTGRAQLALDQTVAARESLEKALGLRPGWLPAVAALTLTDVRAKKYDAALARVTQLLAAGPDNAAALTLKGDVQAAAGKLAEAAVSYAEAQRRRPDASVAVKLFQVRRAAALPKPDESLQLWLALQPGDYRVRGALADYYLTQRSWRSAANEFEAILQQAPANTMALNNLAYAYTQLGDPRAESLAQRAYELAPTSWAVADTLGWILARKGTLERALTLLKQAATAAPTDPELQYHYAFALAQAGRRAEAREILSRVLSDSRDFAARGDAERLFAQLKV